ncbi:MAG: ATP phosphoribosyltransferase regulatory subunit [Alphaproteobacteria bacterium]|nr:ATP phosphoribosyltransferase regulatory subunit [Alphaproteobacteria bacterium]
MKTLLPSGCYDVLPPRARQESQLSSALLDFFAAYGYAQVAPPLLEYSDSLLSGRGVRLSSQMFRVMDPTAHRVMAIRPDITLQIARIASGQMKDAPRPLRLCYNGLILRLSGEQLKNDRQLRQAGIELIGVDSPAADAEVILIAAWALARVGVAKFTIDINLPSIVAALVAGDTLTAEQAQALQTALTHKDTAALAALPLAYKKSLVALVENAGDARKVMQVIDGLDLPVGARALCDHLREVVRHIEGQQEDACTLTIDATESQGYAYHSGIGFTIFAPGVAHEVGRGGRYRIDGPRSGSEAIAHTHEEATGFTLYVETLRSLLPSPAKPPQVLVAAGTSKSDCEKLHAQGYLTLYAQGGDDLKTQAKILGCTQIFEKGKLVSI